MITKLIAKYYTLICKENVQICSRKDYWIFFLIYIGIDILLLFVSTIFENFYFPTIFHLPLFIIYLLISIVLILLSIKRLHDANFSGFWLLLPGVSLIFLTLPSDNKNNKYTEELEVSQEDKEENDKLEKFIELLEKQETKEK